jgi:hypothetical protein
MDGFLPYGRIIETASVAVKPGRAIAGNRQIGFPAGIPTGAR